MQEKVIFEALVANDPRYVNAEESPEFDAFVEGGEAEAENLFSSKGEAVHCLSTRFGSVNYRVSMLIGFVSGASKKYHATYNPNFYSQFTTKRDGESEEHVKSRIEGRIM